MRPFHLPVLCIFAVLVGGCVFGRFEVDGGEPEVPEGPIRQMAEERTGPVAVLGSGLDEETGWRFVAYESEAGLCLQVELDTGDGASAAAGCGMTDTAAGPLTSMGAGTGSNGVGHIAGIADVEVAEVWVDAAGGRRLPARLHDLDQAGVDAQAFFLLVPTEVEPLSVLALDSEGIETGRYDVSSAFR